MPACARGPRINPYLLCARVLAREQLLSPRGISGAGAGKLNETQERERLFRACRNQNCLGNEVLPATWPYDDDDVDGNETRA